MATSKKNADKPAPESVKDAAPVDGLPADVWVNNAYEALGVTPEVVRAALSLAGGDTYNRADVVQAIDAYMKRPVD